MRVLTGLRRARLWLLGGGIAAVLLLLVVTAIRAATTYYYTLPQFRALPVTARTRYLQVSGIVGPVIHWNSADQHLRFAVLAAPPAGGGKGGAPAVAPLPVFYRGPQPDGFTPGIDVVVGGRLGRGGTFKAVQVMVKCPSHYSAAPPGVSGADWPAAGAGAPA